MMLAKVLTSIGLSLDIVGAWLVAIEVVNRFKGEQIKVKPLCPGSIPPPEKTEQFKLWERGRNRWMKAGLALLTTGFLLQILANWIPTDLDVESLFERWSVSTTPAQSALPVADLAGVEPLAIKRSRL